METVCIRVRLEEGSLPLVREWAAELNARRDEVLATLDDEGIAVESVFLDGDELVYYLKARSIDEARATFARSEHAIDAYHAAFREATFAEERALELLVDFERF